MSRSPIGIYRNMQIRNEMKPTDLSLTVVITTRHTSNDNDNGTENYFNHDNTEDKIYA
jgi:hypothetical protein